jgi:4-alpha-glucanotransferase
MSNSPRRPRSSGILLHLSSLPAAHGIGDLGPDARRFVEFLARTGQSLWQVLPVGPTGYGNSPYQSLSAFAGNPLFVSLDRLAAEGWLTPAELRIEVRFPEKRVDFESVIPWKQSRLSLAYEHFRQSGAQHDVDFAQFRAAESEWLDDYTLFAALKDEAGGRAWTQWAPDLVRREPAALTAARQRLSMRIGREEFVQFQFARHWAALRELARVHQVRIMGDIPIFVAHDSADVWAHQRLFHLDSSGHPTIVAGVPPDYFSATGQLWGNPLYRWDVLEQYGYRWWIQRFRHALRLFDLVRLDHFRGFESCWQIPAGAQDARQGQWVAGPGIALFRAAERALGPLPLVAEDLGVITPQVDALREALGAPGMRVLQFAFGDDPKAADYRPHNYPPHCVVYTGTHDNDTTVGWFHSRAGEGTTRAADAIARERAAALAYLGTDGAHIAWDMLRLAWASVADTAVAPLQDVLGLGTEARLNLPGSAEGNWRWRFTAQQLTPAVETRLRTLTRIYDREPEHRSTLMDPLEPDNVAD